MDEQLTIRVLYKKGDINFSDDYIKVEVWNGNNLIKDYDERVQGGIYLARAFVEGIKWVDQDSCYFNIIEVKENLK